MRNGEYGLGIDVGDGAVSAAVCTVDGQVCALPLAEGRVTAAVGDDGAVALVPADGTARLRPLLARVGDEVPVYAGGRAVPAADLVAAAVVRVRERAAEQAGRPDAWTVVTVPPSWAGHRWAVLAAALAEAGVPRFSLVSSAVAAVSAHVAAGDLPAEPTVAVYDLGAGALDTAVVGPMADQPLAHLAGPPAPLPWGGRDVDDAVVAHVAGCLDTPAADPAELRAACVAAKEALSTATVVQVRTAGGPVRLTREELDEVLAEPAQRSAAVLAATVAAAGLRAADLDAVVLAGGGVRVPLVAEVLSGELGRPLVVGADPALTAALGAATLAAGALAAEESVVPEPAVVAPAAVEPVAAVPVGTDPAADDQRPAPALPRPRSARAGQDRTRPGPPPRPAGPAVRRGARLGRGAVVTGLALGLLTLGPAAAGLYDAVLAPPPAGQEAATADDGDVVARGSAAVGDTSSARAAGAPAPAAAPAGGSPARTSLAAAIATAARTDGAPAPGRVAPAPRSTAPGSSSASAGPSRAAGTPSARTSSAGTPDAAGTATAAAPAATSPTTGGPTTPQTPAGPPPVVEEPSTPEQPPDTSGSSGPPDEETPVEQPAPPPATPETVEPAPVDPATAPPPAEEPAPEESAAPEPAAAPGTATAATTTAGTP